MSLNCFHCHRLLTRAAGQSIGRSESCPHCGTDLRVCRNCRHYDLAARWECKEEIQEAVRDKEKGNFCDFFQPRAEAAPGKATNSADELRKKAEALFKK